MVTLLHGDCLELMRDIPDCSIDMILADLPYGTTACKWDVVIPLEPLWEQYKRIIKSNGAIVLTASQPFTSALVMSNVKMFKYEWVWDKKRGANFANVKTQPFKEHENILVFSKAKHTYNPIKILRTEKSLKRYNDTASFKNNGTHNTTGIKRQTVNLEKYRNPRSIIEFNIGEEKRNGENNHPTKKPVALMEYLIKTYTNEGETVLDNVMGSGTTGIACMNTNRNFIGMELDDKYFAIAENRIKEHKQQLCLIYSIG